MARLPSVGEGPLVGLQPCVHLPAHARHLRERGVGDVQRQVVAGGLEHGQRLLDERGQLLRRALRLDGEAEHARLDPPAELADTIARRRRHARRGRPRAAARRRPLPVQNRASTSSDLEGEVELGRRYERGGALEQADGGAVVRRTLRAAAAGGQAPPRRGGQHRRRRASRARRGSGRPARGGSRGSRPARPARPRAAPASRRSARGARRGSPSAARRRRRRGSAGGGSGSRPRPASCGRSGRISSLRTSAARRGVTCVSSGASACTAPRWKISPSTAPRSSTLRSAGSSWSRRAAEQRLQRGRDDHLAVRLAGHRQHLLDEERVAARGARDLARAARRRSARGMSSSTSSSPSGSSRSVTGQAGGARAAPAAPCRAAGSSAPEDRSATCSIRSRNVSSPHWMSSNTTTSGRSAAACSSVLRNAQAISSADVAASVSPEQRADRRRGGLVRGQHVELLQHLDHRPVRDPLAVGQAAAADDRRVDRSQSLRRRAATCRRRHRRRP